MVAAAVVATVSAAAVGRRRQLLPPYLIGSCFAFGVSSSLPSVSPVVSVVAAAVAAAVVAAAVGRRRQLLPPYRIVVGIVTVFWQTHNRTCILSIDIVACFGHCGCCTNHQTPLSRYCGWQKSCTTYQNVSSPPLYPALNIGIKCGGRFGVRSIPEILHHLMIFPVQNARSATNQY